MPQVFVPKENINHLNFRIEGDEAHHVVRVLRKKPQDEIQIFDGEGAQYQVKLMEIDSKGNFVAGKIIKILPVRQVSPKITLFQGLPQGSKFDYVIEKSVELGVDEIVPFGSQKNPIKINPNRGDQKYKRWNALALAASKQSYRSTVPIVRPIQKLIDLSIQNKYALILGFDFSRESVAFKKVVSGQSSIPGEIGVIVGPESGFSDEESHWLKDQGAIQVNLGERVLRTETAGPAILSILNFVYDRF